MLAACHVFFWAPVLCPGHRVTRSPKVPSSISSHKLNSFELTPCESQKAQNRTAVCSGMAWLALPCTGQQLLLGYSQDGCKHQGMEWLCTSSSSNQWVFEIKDRLILNIIYLWLWGGLPGSLCEGQRSTYGSQFLQQNHTYSKETTSSLVPLPLGDIFFKITPGSLNVSSKLYLQ